MATPEKTVVNPDHTEDDINDSEKVSMSMFTHSANLHDISRT